MLSYKLSTASLNRCLSVASQPITLPHQAEEINQAACDLACEVAREGGVLFSGSINQTGRMYVDGAGKEAVQNKFREQTEIFIKNDVDLLIAEVRSFFHSFIQKKMRNALFSMLQQEESYFEFRKSYTGLCKILLFMLNFDLIVLIQ